MKELPQSLFDVYALALPRGHGFGSAPPIRAWQSDDGLAYAVITHDDSRVIFGLLAARRRIDQTWAIVSCDDSFCSYEEAYTHIPALLKEGAPPEPLLPNTAPRPFLHDVGNRKPSDIFRLLLQPTHHVAAWMLNQLYLSLPNPDANWVSDCQTENFHTRLWEAQLLASFREQGLMVSQSYPSPDFFIENRHGGEVWVEAVTANPQKRYNHVNSTPIDPPKDRKERLLGSAAERFAKTIGNKLKRNYHEQEHVNGKPFLIALADFHAPSSMTWSREALICYLYGAYPVVKTEAGVQFACAEFVKNLLGESAFPAGLFADNRHSELSAILFTNACSIAKFNRVGVSAGALTKSLKYTRIGEFFDRRPNALKGIPFCLDVTSQEYRTLWPLGYEPWCAELEVFHNPYAKYPVKRELLPETTHWFEKNGEIVCSSFYEMAILCSKTIIQDESEPTLEIGDFYGDC
ncbi:hypothetical protein [Marinagarivorans cellulosilyticus]|uniref:Glycosaminoglycan attachment site n=1 Tax=Marinagarivorans cellulosilyticus TaxID=2721545 RepID=A0AAN2BK78_9GAMM|nr:hypothetical protein [Marinagarivorans cellulosilyticus]BCD97710.1 hypothetical protein MARGE09_P1911 [Marinagarivorans cellulosilyticus]